MVLNPDLLTLKSQPFLPDPIDNTEYPQHAIPHTGAGDGPAPESHLTARVSPRTARPGKAVLPAQTGHCPGSGSPGPRVSVTGTSRESL